MATLPRELIKWLQSLDLSLPVKNAKRDFCNGYIVAEILARYWAEVSLHSFENGLSLKTKSDNWALLAKYCRKREVLLTQELVDSVIHQRGGAAMEMIAALYTSLTGRELQLPPVPTTVTAAAAGAAAVPSYALPTAGQLLREANPEAQHVERKITRDTERVQRQNLAVLQQHAELLRQAKAAHPEHFRPRPRPSLEKGKGASRSERQMGDLVEIDVKNCPALPRNRTDLVGPGKDEASEEGVLTLLSTICQPLLGSSNNTLPKGESVTKFIAHIPEQPRDVCNAVWARWQSKAADVADIILSRPSEMALLVKCMQPVWDRCAPTSEDWLGLERLLARVGGALSATLPIQTAALYRQFLLPLHRPFLDPHQRTNARRASCLRLLHAFNMGGPSSCRLSALHQLQQVLLLPPPPAQPAAFIAGGIGPQLCPSSCNRTFLCCLATLAEMKPTTSEQVLQFFTHTALVGLRSPSPTARVASLSLLNTVANRRRLHLVLPALEHVQALARTPGGTTWEEQAQGLVLCSALLDGLRQTRNGHLPKNDDDEEEGAEEEDEDAWRMPLSGALQQSIMSLVIDSLDATSSVPARSIGLTALAHHVSTSNWGDVDPAAFLRKYMALVTGLPGGTRITLLSEGAVEEELPGLLRVYKVGPAAPRWAPIAAAQGLAAHVAEVRRGRPALSAQQLHACLEVLALAVLADRVDVDEDRAAWLQVLRAIGGDLHNALQHPSLLEDALHELLYNTVTRFFLALGPSEEAGDSLEALQQGAVAWFMRWPDL